MEKISIIIPAYNTGALIAKTIASIQAQTYPNIEIVVVNDGSSDDTPTILDQIAKSDERVKVFHQENGGVTSARLHGVAEAIGDWIGFVDGDDYVEPTMYETLLKNARTYNADISHCGYRIVYPSRVEYVYGTQRVVEQDHMSGLKDLLEGVFIEPSLCNKLFRRELFDTLLFEDLMDPTIKNLEDLLMNFYLFREADRSIYYDICPYYYTARKGSASKSKLNAHQLYDPIRVLETIEKATTGQPTLHLIAQRRIAARLIAVATISKQQQNELAQPYHLTARKELKRRLPSVLRAPFPIKNKIMALWVCFWPASYRFVHTIYARITGLDKKYEVN